MDFEILKDTMLFRGMTVSEITEAVQALKGAEKTFARDQIILSAGSETDRMGLVLDGSVTIESNDLWGNCTILSHVPAGQFFAETYALLPGEVMLVDVRANEACRILFLKAGMLLNETLSASWKVKMTTNLLMISAHKNLALSGRSFHTSPKSARGRILSYLNSVALRKHASEFDIPFNRQQMADYLNLERTNMSKELSKMKAEGIIDFRKNHFRLIRPDYFKI